jgi:hypothetical protein
MENNTRGFIDNNKYISISYDDNIECMDFEIDSCWLCNISIDNKFKDIQLNDDNQASEISINLYEPKINGYGNYQKENML